MTKLKNILVAVDSFKGSLSAKRACQQIANAIGDVKPDINCICTPMADGGEGTVESMIAASGGEVITAEVTGPLGEKIEAFFGLLAPGHCALVEMAAASGLPLVPEGKRNPLHTTSYGTGELIAAALDRNIDKLIVCIGGSATTDLGAGMVQALGAKFLRADGSAIDAPLTGATISEVADIDLAELHPAIASCNIEVACDVTNPLLGPDGAAAVFGPQKGASAADVELLEANLSQLADIIERRCEMAIRDMPGAGAAGGLGAALAAVLGARLLPGIDIVMETVNLAEKIRNADLVITGEGRIDATTVCGKTIAGICAACRSYNVPVAALAGQVSDREKLEPLGLLQARAITPAGMPLSEAIANAPQLLHKAATELITELLGNL